MKQVLLFEILGTAALVVAQRLREVDFVYPGIPHYFLGPPIFGNQTVNELVNNASIGKPEVSRRIAFNPFVDDADPGSTPEEYRDVEWTWHVNLTRTAMGNDSAQRMISTWNSLSWPGGQGNITSQLPEPEQKFCIRALHIYRWPANITNSIGEDDAPDGSCAPALGQECVNALLDIAKNSTQNTHGRYLGCSSFRVDWENDIPECSSSIGRALLQSLYARHESNYIPTLGLFEMSSYSLDSNTTVWPRTVINSNRSRDLLPDTNDGTTPYRSWYPFFGTNSDVYDHDDVDADWRWWNATNKLQVMLFQTTIPGTDNRKLARKLVCTRVNTSDWDPPSPSPWWEEIDNPAARSAYATSAFGWVVATVILGMGFL